MQNCVRWVYIELGPWTGTAVNVGAHSWPESVLGIESRRRHSSQTSQAHPTFRNLDDISPAMISNARSNIVRPVVCTSQQSKAAPAARAPRTTRRAALRLSVAMAAAPLIEIYVKGNLKSTFL